MEYVIKRDGSQVTYNKDKIFDAIKTLHIAFRPVAGAPWPDPPRPPAVDSGLHSARNRHLHQSQEPPPAWAIYYP